MGMIPKPESQQFQRLTLPNKSIMPTSSCNVGTDQISLQFSELLFCNKHY